MIAEARITWPTVRRIKFISRITVATILTDAIESAVPRKSDVIRRLLGSGSIEFGQGFAERNPASEWHDDAGNRGEADAPPVRRTSFRSVSMPVRSKSIRTPNCETASSMAFCSFAAGKIACCQSGASAPSSGRAEHQARNQLPHHARLLDADHGFAKQPPDEHQQHELRERTQIRRDRVTALGREGGCASR